MSVLAVKGTSWFMSVIIWILSLFGIHIGGGGDKPEQKTYLYLPPDTSLVLQDETLEGPQKLERKPQLSSGDKYITEDYTYTYGNADSAGYWSVKVNDKTKSEYSAIQSQTKTITSKDEESYIDDLFGAKVEDLNYCFSDCVNLVNSPAIPKSVIYMVGAFKGCTKLTEAPNLSNKHINMYETFENCPNIKFADGYAASFDMVDGAYSYIVYNASKQCWKAQVGYAAGNLKKYTDILSLIKGQYAGYSVDVSNIKADISGICTLELYQQSNYSYAWCAVKKNSCSNDDFNAWLEKNKTYENIAVVKTETGSVEINGVCSLIKVNSTDAYKYVIGEKYTTDERIASYFAENGFRYQGGNVDCSSLSVKVGHNTTLMLVDITFANTNPATRKWVWQIAGNANDSDIGHFHQNGYMFNNIPVSLENVSLKFSNFSFDFICSNSQNYKNGYWKLNIAPASSSTQSILSRLYEDGFRMSGFPVNIDGVVFISNDIIFTAHQDGLNLNTRYFTASINSARYGDMIAILNNMSDPYYNNYKFYNIPLNLDGVSFEDKDSGITFTLHQEDKYKPETKYFTASAGYTEVMLDMLSSSGKVNGLLKEYYSNYKLFNIPVNLDGISLKDTDSGITFTLHQEDKYKPETKYFTVSTKNDEADDRMLYLLSGSGKVNGVLKEYYNNYRLFNIPLNLNGISFEVDRGVYFTLIQTNSFDPSTMYFKPSADDRVKMFMFLAGEHKSPLYTDSNSVYNNFKCFNIPVKVDGEILADGLSDEAVFTFHQDSKDCSNVWITVSAGKDGSLTTAFNYVKRNFKNGLFCNTIPIKMEGLTIQSLGYSYVYHEGSTAEKEHWSVVVNIPEELTAAERTEFVKNTKEKVGETFLDIPVNVIFYLENVLYMGELTV